MPAFPLKTEAVVARLPVNGVSPFLSPVATYVKLGRLAAPYAMVWVSAVTVIGAALMTKLPAI